jgi:hypothetical protein
MGKMRVVRALVREPQPCATSIGAAATIIISSALTEITATLAFVQSTTVFAIVFVTLAFLDFPLVEHLARPHFLGVQMLKIGGNSFHGLLFNREHGLGELLLIGLGKGVEKLRLFLMLTLEECGTVNNLLEAIQGVLWGHLA